MHLKHLKLQKVFGAIFGVQIAAAILVLIALLISAPAKALTLPDMGEMNPIFENNRYETRLVKLSYTAFGDMAYSTYRGAPSVLLSDGSSQSLGELYKPKNRDVEALFVTKLARSEWKNDRTYQVSLLWGGSTGQESAKLYVQSSLKLGLIGMMQTGEASLLTLSAQTTIGGALKERACTADYGVAGTHQVKCSLASSNLPPADTLKYLVNRGPYDATQFKVSWQWFFD